MEENLTDDRGHALVQDLAHHQVQEPLLVLDKHLSVVRMSGQVVQGVGCSPQHIQTCSHTVRVISQSVHSVLLRHYQGVGLGLLNEPDEEADCVLLEGDGSRHTRVGLGEVEEQVDGELPHHLILGPVELLGKKAAELLYSGEWGRGQQEVNIVFLKQIGLCRQHSSYNLQ